MRTYTIEELRSMTVSNLHLIAKARKIKYYKRLKKEELINEILVQQKYNIDFTKPRKPQTEWKPLPQNDGYSIFDYEHEFRKHHLTLKVTGGKDAETINEYLDNAKGTFVKAIDTVEGSNKVSIGLVIKFKILTPDDEILYDDIHIRSQTRVKDPGSNTNSLYTAFKLDLWGRLDFIKNRGSGYTFLKVKEAHINFDRFEQILGGCYVSLPDELKNKKALIVPQNQDNYCFKYAATISAFLSTELKGHRNLHRVPNVVKRLAESKFNWNKVSFPATKKSIAQFERNNPEYGVNILYWNENNSKVLRRSTKKLAINLYWYEQHYCA